ncbi:hypothetical protein HaLaN_05610, partial [Haematococcus lacustris]
MRYHTSSAHQLHPSGGSPHPGAPPYSTHQLLQLGRLLILHPPQLHTGCRRCRSGSCHSGRVTAAR